MTGQAGRIVRDEIRADLDPEAFLRWAGGVPRGFWARGEAWVAHAGEVARLEAPGGGEGGARFRQVAAAARRLLAPDGAAAPSRLYGGFSFRADHEPTGFWEGFPPARFILPEVELEGGPAGAVLRARARLAEEEQDDAARALLRRRLESVRAEVSAVAGVLAGAGGTERAHPEPPLPHARGNRAAQRAAWEATVRSALAAIGAGEVEKVVLARTLDVTPPEPLDPVDVFVHLRRENPGTHAFFFEPVPGAPFLGAAPETVATLFDGVFRATAVAGSISGGRTEAEREEQARRLLRSGKDRIEHACTVEEIVRRLAPLAEDVSVDSEPHVLSLARIQHLETRVRARAREGESVLSLLAALHPTPAVCGLPGDAALDFLHAEEPFERGWYAGPVGWFDAAGNGVFVPALRSAVSSGGSWRLIAGAGIVPGSDPGLEWEETGMKFEPVLRALARSGRVG